MQLAVLAGGVGAARFLSGLVHLVPPESITAIINTGDDFVFYGLYISPDIDIITYTLAGIVNPEQGWGIGGDSFACLKMMGRLGHPTWFHLGDQDLGTHIHRTLKLHQGYSLAQVTDEIRKALGVRVKLLPMSNQPVRTHIHTGKEIVSFQEYFVKRNSEEPVKKIIYTGIEEANPAPGVLEALREASGIIIPPSNPFVSIGTILAAPGIRTTLRESRAPVVAISPIVGGKTVKGPADKMMHGLGYEVSAFGVAKLYQDLLDAFILDVKDSSLKETIERLGIKVFVVDTIMDTEAKKVNLAQMVLNVLGI